MNLHLLRVFFHVAEQGSFSRAAAALYISQPAVSKAVRELEKQVGLPLMERGASGASGGRGFQLTDSGRALYEHARGIFALERAAAEDILARVGSQRGRLIVGASTTIAGYWLPSYAARFLHLHPSIHLEVRVGNTQEVSRSLIECEIDLALVEGIVEDPRILMTAWQEDEMHIFTHPGSKIDRKQSVSAEVLKEEIWLVREPGSGTREVSERMLQDHGILPDRMIQIGSNEGIARTVAAGVGIAILPALVARELVNLDKIRAVNFEPMHRSLFLLQLKERPQQPLVQKFIEILRHDSR